MQVELSFCLSSRNGHFLACARGKVYISWRRISIEKNSIIRKTLFALTTNAQILHSPQTRRGASLGKTRTLTHVRQNCTHAGSTGHRDSRNANGACCGESLKSTRLTFVVCFLQAKSQISPPARHGQRFGQRVLNNNNGWPRDGKCRPSVKSTILSNIKAVGKQERFPLARESREREKRRTPLRLAIRARSALSSTRRWLTRFNVTARSGKVCEPACAL